MLAHKSLMIDLTIATSLNPKLLLGISGTQLSV